MDKYSPTKPPPSRRFVLAGESTVFSNNYDVNFHPLGFSPLRSESDIQTVPSVIFTIKSVPPLFSRPTTLIAASIDLVGGEVNTAPATAAVSIPSPTNPA